jgi:hypothetical protein
MKSLDERMWAVDGGLWCPYTDSDLAVDRCIAEFCAHYNPDTHECVHVEAAMAQVRAAEALTGLYSLLKQVVVDDGCVYVKEC